MKGIILALVLCLALGVGMAYAEDSGRGEYTTPVPGLTDYLNNNDDFYHSHQYDMNDEYDHELGIGADVNIWNFDEIAVLDSVGVEGRWDFNNEKGSVYAVVKLDLTDLYQK